MTAKFDIPSIGIFDDHPLLLGGVAHYVEQNTSYEIAFQAQHREELFNQLETQLPTILLLDIVVPGVKGLDLFQELLERWPQLRIVAYTSLKSKLLIRNLLRLGVCGYVNKRQRMEDLAICIEQVLQDKIWVPEEYITLSRPHRSEESRIQLSARETQTLEFIMQGLLTKEIAGNLEISVSTVEKFRSSLFKKFQVDNVAELIVAAQQLGY